jgi:hypothetical protein
MEPMNRREILKLGTAAMSGLYPAIAAAQSNPPDEGGRRHQDAEQWGVFEASFGGPSMGNPFVDVNFSARFTLQNRTVNVPGFYDGAGVYRVRFMPDATGAWSYETVSNAESLAGKTGSFQCVAPTGGNHGPVQVAHSFHFQHADGAPYFPFGTTCYAWAYLGEALEEETLSTLRAGPFNKVRMCVLPKPIDNAPLFAFPFVRHADGSNDLTQLNPAYFQHIEKRVQDLLELDIQADLILFHPYDSWGYKSMPADADDRYLRYVIARFSAYRNVWWSIANEFDLFKEKTPADWDRFFRIVQESDPSNHLRSIHYSKVLYDYSKAWVTHASLQNYAFDKAAEWRIEWNKPIVFDEIQYEGNISRRWGNLSAQEMTRRFWLSAVAGTYTTHGETYVTAAGQPESANGGAMHGDSPARIGFLRKVLEESTATGLTQFDGTYYLSAGDPGRLYLYFFDYHQPAEYEFPLPQDTKFTAEIIDPWEMTITPVAGTFSGNSKLTLPGKPYMAARFRKVT